MVLVEISSEERKSRSLHGYCKMATNHRSLTLTIASIGDLQVSGGEQVAMIHVTDCFVTDNNDTLATLR